MDYLSSLLTYSILPPLLTSTLQSALYATHILPPQPSHSPSFIRDKKALHTFLVVLFLVYSVYTAHTGLSPSYYTLLGMPTSATSADLRSRFKLLYPDPTHP